MQAGVFAFFPIDVNRDLLSQAQRLAVDSLEMLQIRREDVVRFARGDALRELSMMVGVDFPLRLLVFGAANPDGHPIYRAIIGPPDGSGDERVGLLFRLLGREQAVF